MDDGLTAGKMLGFVGRGGQGGSGLVWLLRSWRIMQATCNFGYFGYRGAKPELSIIISGTVAYYPK